jgi:hypothetical protein
MMNIRNIRNKIKVGNIVLHKGKKYLVSGVWFDCGGNAMIVDLIKPTEGESIRFVKHIYDGQIEDCTIIQSKFI